MTRSVSLLFLLALAACAPSDEAPAADSAAAQSADAPTSVLKPPPIAPGSTAQAALMAEQLKDIGAYRLDMAKIDQYIAAQRNILGAAARMTAKERDAMRARGLSRTDPTGSLENMVRSIESEPVMANAVRDAGLTPRDYTLLSLSLMQTAMAAKVAAGQPSGNQDSMLASLKASRANVDFFRANEAEIQRKTRALQAEMQRLTPKP